MLNNLTQNRIFFKFYILFNTISSKMKKIKQKTCSPVDPKKKIINKNVIPEETTQNIKIKQLPKITPTKTRQTQPITLIKSSEHEILCEELDRIKLNQIEDCFKEIPVLPDITAIIIKACSAFTLAFLMIPEGKYFGWHDHSRMNGISRIIAGDIRIRSINPDHFQPFTQNIHLYPVDRIRQQTLTPTKQKLSIIYPDSYNIHQIIGLKQSCFLDLLIPEYPDNSCHYYVTCDQPIVQGQVQDKIKIKRVEESCQQIIGLETLVKIIKEGEKEKLKQKVGCKNSSNIILVRNDQLISSTNSGGSSQHRSKI